MKDKQTSIVINPDVWMRAKIFAMRSPMTVSEYLERALVEYMKAHPLPEDKSDKGEGERGAAGETRA